MAGDQANEPIPHLATIFEEEEGQQESDDEAGEELADAHRAAVQAARHAPAAAGSSLLDGVVHTLVELLPAEVERPVREHVGGLANAVLHALTQVARLVADGWGDRGCDG